MNIDNINFEGIFNGKEIYDIIYSYEDKSFRLKLVKKLSQYQKHLYTNYRNNHNKQIRKLNNPDIYKTKNINTYVPEDVIKEQNRERARKYRERQFIKKQEEIKNNPPKPKEPTPKKDRTEYQRQYYLKRKAKKQALNFIAT